MQEQPLSTKQAAALAQKNQRTIVAWIQRGWLPAMKMPGKRGPYLIKEEDLRELIRTRYTPEPYEPEGK